MDKLIYMDVTIQELTKLNVDIDSIIRNGEVKYIEEQTYLIINN